MMSRRLIAMGGLLLATLPLTACAAASASGGVTTNDDASWSLGEKIYAVLQTAPSEDQTLMCSNYLALVEGTGTQESGQALADFIDTFAEAVAQEQGYTTEFTQSDYGTAGMLALGALCE